MSPQEIYHMEYDQILRLLIGTRLGERLSSIQKLFSQLETAQKRFQEVFCIGCTEGCGSCCEHFYPNITNLEAEYMALGLMFEGRDQQILDMIHITDKEPSSCPLYRKDTPYHCSCYAIRPLVCRLFGMAVSKDKEGRPAFRNCRWNERKIEISKENLELNRKVLVTMSDYGMELEYLQPGDPKTYPLLEALERAIYKIRFLIHMESDPEPEPNAS